MPLVEAANDKKPDQSLRDANPAAYAKAVHQFMMGAARSSVAHAPVMRTLALMDLKEKRTQLREHLEHLRDHPDAVLDQKDRAKLGKAGVRPPKAPPSQKDFGRMIAALQEGAAAEAALFTPQIIMPQPKFVDGDGNEIAMGTVTGRTQAESPNESNPPRTEEVA